MKKLHFSLMAILFALFSMVSFTACSSDDDDAPSQDDIKTNCTLIPQHYYKYNFLST